MIANPFVRSSVITFPRVFLVPTPVGGWSDTIQLTWADGSGTGSVRTGSFPTGTTLSLAAAGANSLQSPGGRFRFRTGPTWAGSGTYIEQEAGGFTTSQVSISGNGTSASAAITTLVPHERVLGIVQRIDDTVDMRLPASPHPVVVALWLEHPDTFAVSIWARCGSRPTPTAFDATMETAPAFQFPTWHGAVLDLPQCATGWNLSVTSVSATDRVFHLIWGAHAAGNAIPSQRIGVSFDASPADLATMRTNLQAAAWAVWGMTGGAWVIPEFQLFNNAVNCDEAWPTDQAACGGQDCRACLVSANEDEWINGGPCHSVSDPQDKITLCRTNGWDDPWVIAHEFGHSILGLLDEYHMTSQSCPSPASRGWELCWSSVMSGHQSWSLCNTLDHRLAQEDWRGNASGDWENGWTRAYGGTTAYTCNGYALWTNESAAWPAVNNAAPFDLPADWSPHDRNLREVWSDPAIGLFTRTE